MRNLFLLTLILVLASTGSWAMDSIGPVFQSSQGISTSRGYKPEYDGSRDDRVYIATAKQESRYYQPKKIKLIAVQGMPEAPIESSATICDDNSCANLDSIVKE